MLNHHGNSTITVNRSELLETVKSNRAAHQAAYEEAAAGYMKELRNKLIEATQQAQLGIDSRGMIADMEVPRSHVKTYDRVIAMLTMSCGTEIEITEPVFRELVLDEWDWKEKFINVSSSYSKVSGRG